ncbi:hypothetical protein DPMN_048738 [Dreissena polymorpha]|uniref:Uncharacterized protein n=1 Tax=Dreissena polymorpha TaxID=45954 RepID=A0A9D4DDX8_DREPO|nr:hypothetical protein DPMN_048738 [Dreissena polymorpha]
MVLRNNLVIFFLRIWLSTSRPIYRLCDLSIQEDHQRGTEQVRRKPPPTSKAGYKPAVQAAELQNDLNVELLEG